MRRLYVEDGCAIARELYLGVVIDRAASRLTLMASTEGGVDIEEVAARTPDKIIRVAIDPAIGFQPFHGRQIAFGLGLGFLFGLPRSVGEVYEPLLAACYAIPSVVWYPSLMLFFGLGPASKIAFGFLLGFFPIVLAVLTGLRSVDHQLLVVARAFGAGPWTTFARVVLPAITATLVAGLRTGLALTVVGVLVGEVLGARAGLGYLINHAYGFLRTAEYAALALLALVLVLLIDGLGALAESRARRWTT